MSKSLLCINILIYDRMHKDDLVYWRRLWHLQCEGADRALHRHVDGKSLKSLMHQRLVEHLCPESRRLADMDSYQADQFIFRLKSAYDNPDPELPWLWSMVINDCAEDWFKEKWIEVAATQRRQHRQGMASSTSQASNGDCQPSVSKRRRRH